MRIKRVFQNINIREGEVYSLDQRSSHYLVQVLRTRMNEVIEIFNGDNKVFSCEILSLSKKGIQVKCLKVIEKSVESSFQIHLGQVILRGEKMDWVIQKSVELGVHAIHPLLSERCEVRLDAKREASRMNHWKGVAISACEQSGRNYLPKIDVPQTIESWNNSLTSNHKFILDPQASTHFKNIGSEVSKAAILLGPEGGFSEQEVMLAKKLRFRAIQMGPRVLRAETASLTAISLLQSQFGDLG